MISTNELTDVEKAFLLLQNICLNCRRTKIDNTQAFHHTPSMYAGLCMICAIDKAASIVRELNE